MKLVTRFRDPNIVLQVSKSPPAYKLWVRPAANLFPVDENGDILLMHEFKTATKRWIWGFPGGMIEPGETAAEAANRESQEEIGLRAGRLRKIAEVKTDFPETSVTYFLGYGLKKAESKGWEKIGVIKKMPLSRLVKLALAGKIQDPRMVVAIMRLEDLVRRGKVKGLRR
jgi:ADP-ribose diphosphatase